MILSLLTGAYGKLVTIFIGAIGIVATIWRYTYKVRSSEREKIERQMYKRTLERVEHAKNIEDSFNHEPDDILNKLRENGWLRE